MLKQRLLNGILCLTTAILFSGCAETSSSGTSYEDAETAETPAGHGHHHEGPHGGHVLEVDGNHKYHCEMTFDAETRDVTVYLLGGDLKTPVPVAADDVEFEIEEGDDEEHIAMTSEPLEGEEGVSSVFKVPGSKIPESAKSLNDFHWHMHVTIDSEEYNVAMGHEEHGDHEAHGDHKGHGKGEEHGDGETEGDQEHKEGDKDK